MKSLKLFLRVLLEDLGELCGVSTTHDHKTIMRRVEEEGLSFLTITLPTLGQALERGLADEVFTAQQCPAFTTGHGSLPLLLGGFFEQIFDSKTGVLFDKPDIECIRAIRQVSYLLKRLDLPCTDERVEAAYARYIECDKEVEDSLYSQVSQFSPLRVDFRIMASRLFGDMFNRISGSIDHGDMLPNHSSGSTADRMTVNGRYLMPYWTERLETLFPSLENCFPNYGWYSSSEYYAQRLLSPEHEPPVRVICVPKTQKTPRIIAMEPAHMMYVQQGLLEMFKRHMRADTNAREFVCFDSQEPNQQLARIGSMNGSLATIDLSDASDRVSLLHVTDLLEGADTLKEAVLASRSAKAEVHGHGEITLAKFASMGSAMCFPMESMVFMTIVAVGIARSRNTHVTRLDLAGLYGKVRIYGDDIVVPVGDAEVVMQTLEDYGLKVNPHKSFWTGRFRESCGKDYYASVDVSVHRLKRLLPSSRRDVDGIVSAVSFRNHLALSGLGYERTVAFLDERIERLIPFPYVTEESMILGKIDPVRAIGQRMDPALQVPMVYGAWKHSRPPSDQLDEYGALMKYFLKRTDKPREDVRHLSNAGRDQFAKIKTGWGRL